jgi:hypothetical protein
MRIERTIKRDNGDEVVIVAKTTAMENIIHSVYRKEESGIRLLKLKPEYELKHVTPFEIHSVKMELWEKLKPKM